MRRDEAVKKLRKIVGEDLVELARTYGVTIWKNGKLNKGWAGHVIERYLDLPLNSSQSPDFGSWELKVVSLIIKTDGKVVPKETMAITMLDPENVKETPFEKSHLFEKLRKMVVCARIFISSAENCSPLFRVSTFDLESGSQIYKKVKQDYELVRKTIRDQGFKALSGKMGELIQPRTKGQGNGSTTRAFYARKEFISIILGL